MNPTNTPLIQHVKHQPNHHANGTPNQPGLKQYFPMKEEEQPKEIGKERWEPVFMHPRVTKGMLAFHFSTDIRMLRRRILNNKMLIQCEISPERYKEIYNGHFSINETEMIYKCLNMTHLKVS